MCFWRNFKFPAANLTLFKIRAICTQNQSFFPVRELKVLNLTNFLFTLIYRETGQITLRLMSFRETIDYKPKQQPFFIFVACVCSLLEHRRKSVHTPPHFHCMPIELMQTKKCYVFNTSSNLIQLHKCTFCINTTERTPHKFCELESQFISRPAWDNLDNRAFRFFLHKKMVFHRLSQVEHCWCRVSSFFGNINTSLNLRTLRNHYSAKYFFALYSNHEQPNHQFVHEKKIIKKSQMQFTTCQVVKYCEL